MLSKTMAGKSPWSMCRRIASWWPQTWGLPHRRAADKEGQEEKSDVGAMRGSTAGADNSVPNPPHGIAAHNSRVTSFRCWVAVARRSGMTQKRRRTHSIVQLIMHIFMLPHLHLGAGKGDQHIGSRRMKQGAHHVGNPTRDRIHMRTVLTDHRTLLNVDLIPR
jgi:hypothetical protein